jgi:hypothetical protein
MVIVPKRNEVEFEEHGSRIITSQWKKTSHLREACLLYSVAPNPLDDHHFPAMNIAMNRGG